MSAVAVVGVPDSGAELATGATSMKSIGCLLRQAERRVVMAFDGALAQKDLSSIHWRILLAVDSDGVASIGSLHDAACGRINARDLREQFDLLIERGWVRPIAALDRDGSDIAIAFTPLGRWAFADVRKIEQRLAATLMSGIAEDDYRIACRVLERMIWNLGGTE